MLGNSFGLPLAPTPGGAEIGGARPIRSTAQRTIDADGIVRGPARQTNGQHDHALNIKEIDSKPDAGSGFTSVRPATRPAAITRNRSGDGAGAKRAQRFVYSKRRISLQRHEQRPQAPLPGSCRTELRSSSTSVHRCSRRSRRAGIAPLGAAVLRSFQAAALGAAPFSCSKLRNRS